MQKKFIPGFQGENNVQNPQNLPDDVLYRTVNYEIPGLYRLEKRKDATTYDSDLNSAISGVFNTVSRVSEPFHPVRKPTDMTNEFMLAVYGYTGSAYKLHLFYETSGGSWVYQSGGNDLTQGIYDAGVTYTANSDLDFFVGGERIIICDGINHVHYIGLDEDGNIVSGALGFGSPGNKATVAELTNFSSKDWKYDDSGNYVGAPGLFQCVYTVETTGGEESNPSPISNTLDLQLFKIAPNGEDERWIKQVEISNLSIPPASPDVIDSLRYFNVYCRVIRYSAGTGVKILRYSQQFAILDKANTSGATGNSYIITMDSSTGEAIGYDQDIAPIAKTSAQLSGITMIGNIERGLSLPDFDYIIPIKLKNLDGNNYIDDIVRIRLYDAGSGETDAISNLDWNDFDTDSDAVIEHLNRLRIYDNDLTSPLLTSYRVDASLGWCDIWVKLPQFAPGDIHTIYFCFSTTAEAISNSDYQTYDYGEWFSLDSDPWADQIMFRTVRVLNRYNIISCPVEIQTDSDNITNEANTNVQGVPDSGNREYSGATMFFEPASGLIGDRGYQSINGVNRLRFDFEDIWDQQFPQRASFWGYFKHSWDGAPNNTTEENLLIHLKIKSSTPPITGFVEIGINSQGWPVDEHRWFVSQTANTSTKTVLDDFGNGNPDALDGQYYFLYFSYTTTQWMLYIMDKSGNYYYQSGEWTIDGIDGDNSAILRYVLVVADQTGVNSTPVNYIDISNFQLVGYAAKYFGHNKWTAGYDIEALNSIHNINASNQLKENAVGYKLFGDNVITNPDIAGATGWLVASPSDWSFGGSQANHAAGSGNDDDIGQDGVFVNGKTYLLAIGVSVSGGTSLTVKHGGSTILTITSSGSFYKEFTAGSTDLNITASNDFDGSIASVYVWEKHSYNNNVVFEDAETSTAKGYSNMLQWSNINALNIPDTYYKFAKEPVIKIIPAPSFLPFQYQNTFIIFTRNTIGRFVLEGSSGDWAGSSEVLIDEKAGFGLLAKRSLVRTNDALYWLSEVGIIRWSAEGMAKISKDRVDVPKDEDAIGYYIPGKNQYALHYQEEPQ